MKKTTLALSIITAFGLWGCVGSSSGDDQPIDQGHSQQQHHINPSQNTDDNNNNNNDNGNSGNAGSTGGAGGATGHISGGSAGGQPIADDDSSNDDKTGGNDDNDDNDNGSDVIPTVAEAQKKVADLEKKITDSQFAAKGLQTKKVGVNAELAEVKKQIKALTDKASLSDLEKQQLKELQEKSLPEAQQAADNAQKAVTENAAKTAELNTEKDVANVGVQISEAKYQNYEPKSKIDALKAQQAVIKATALATEKKGEVQALEDKIGKEATSTGQAATGLQKDLQEAEKALQNASEEKRPELTAAVVAAEKALANAQTEKANADKAKSEADTAQAAAEAAKKEAEEADLNRAVVGTSGFDLKTFQNEDSVERTASASERANGSIWTVHLNDGSTLDIVPATITSRGYWLGENSNYYGNIDNKNGIRTYPDSAFGYLGDKFFSVGKTTKITDMPKSETFGYVGSALLKSAEGKDLFATVKAKADFSNNQLSGNFSEFKSYDRAKALKADKNSGYAGDAEAPKDLANPVNFQANIKGNRFEPLISASDQDPVKVYGYFYGATNDTGGKTLNQNADEIGGLVQYSKFHGAFGAKHHKSANKCYSSSNYQVDDC